jgi:tellurite resistance protein
MGWFEQFKSKVTQITVSPAGGEWAAIAMACMVFADGNADDFEIESAKESCTTNPVILNSIGKERALKVFQGTIEAIEFIPQVMVPSYEEKLQILGKRVNKAEDRDHALATVLAVAYADGRVGQAEKEMLGRFKDYIGATIDIQSL